MKRLNKTTRLTIELNELHKKQLLEHPKIAEEALLDFCRVVIGFRMMTHPKNVFKVRREIR